MTVSILVPFRSDGGERDRIWAWARERWHATMPDCELVVCSDGSSRDEPFNEGIAWNTGARIATGDILVLAESEVVNSSLALRAAIESVEREGGWRIAETYYQLNEVHTARLLRMPSNIPLEYPLPRSATERIFFRESVSSNIVVPREAFDLRRVGLDRQGDGGRARHALPAVPAPAVPQFSSGARARPVSRLQSGSDAPLSRCARQR